MDLQRLGFRFLLALGVTVVVAGIALVVSPSAAFPVGLFAVGMIAVAAFGGGLWLVRDRRRHGVVGTETPNPEFPLATPTPGDDIDTILTQLTKYREGTLEYREQIRDRLGNVALAVIMHRDDCSRAEAMQKLEEGEWTDDVQAASFFGPNRALPSRSLTERLFGTDETPYQEWVRTTVDEIAGLADIDVGGEESATADEPEGFVENLKRQLNGDGEDEALDDSGYRLTHDLHERIKNGDLVAEGVIHWNALRTNRWRGVSAFALLAVGVGAFTFQPGLVLASVVGIGYTIYTRFDSTPSAAGLIVERHFDVSNPQPNEEVEVTVTVRNRGGTTLPDVRLIDEVPGTLRVVEGSPRVATMLRPGNSVSFQYTIVAERGEHSWPLLAVVRNVSGTEELEATVEAEATLVSTPSLKSVTSMPLRSQTSVYSGNVSTEQGGAGLEFFSVREYREGDPMKRVDWKRHARTGELTTIDFRQERAASVVLLFDSRQSAYLSPGPGKPHAVDQAVNAAADVFPTLYDEGNLVGVAAFDTVPCWLSPSAGSDHLERARLLFANHPALSSIPPDYTDHEARYVDPMTHVRRQLPSSAQILLFTPLSDDYASEVAMRLDSAGHLVTVISPDPTSNRTVGQRLARVERSMRVSLLRERGIRVVDWEPESQLHLEMQRAQQRWTA